MAVRAAGSVTVASITDVASTTRWYLLQSSTLTAPAKPTASPPGGSWAATEPTYAEGSTNSLYACDETIFSDGTWAYSAVSLSTSYEAAKAAYNKAAAAAAAAAATDNHFWWDADGAHVSSTDDHDLSGLNLLLTSAKLAFRKALAELFSIDAVNGVISSLGGLVTIRGVEWHRGGTDYEGVGMHSTQDGVEMSCDSSWDGEPACVAARKESASGEAGGCVDLSGQWLFVKDPSLAADGVDVSMSALWALLVGMGKHTWAGESAITLGTRFATAIQPVVLYNGPNTACDYDTAPTVPTSRSGEITLSETAANFKRLTFFYVTDDGWWGSVEVPFPNGKKVTMTTNAYNGVNMTVKSKTVLVSGTSVNAFVINGSYSTGIWGTANNATTGDYIGIVRVEGRR